jgi:nickel superoxide dismutase
MASIVMQLLEIQKYVSNIVCLQDRASMIVSHRGKNLALPLGDGGFLAISKKEDVMKESILRCSVFLSLLLFVLVNNAYAHCEIPCGIYDDEMRFEMIGEHIATVEKSVQMITELSKEVEKNYNQIVRWVNNKEEHANHIQEIVSQYFLTQRVKVADTKDKDAYQKYVKQVVLLHQMLVYAMKAKQSVDLSNIEQLRTLLDEFEGIYLNR